MECPDGVYTGHVYRLRLSAYLSLVCERVCVCVCSGCARWCMRAYDCRIDSVQTIPPTKLPNSMGIFSRNSQIRLCAMNMWSYTRMLWQTNFEFQWKIGWLTLDPPKCLNFNVFSSSSLSLSFPTRLSSSSIRLASSRVAEYASKCHGMQIIS